MTHRALIRTTAPLLLALACSHAWSQAARPADLRPAMGASDGTRIEGGTALLSVNDSARAEVGRPVQEAQELIRNKQFDTALEKLAPAEAVRNLTDYEFYVVYRTKAAAAQGAGKFDLAIEASQKVIHNDRLPPGQRLDTMAALADLSYRLKRYPEAVSWAQRYLSDGGTNVALRTLLIQSQFYAGDYAAVVAALKPQADASEPTLRMLAAAQSKLDDQAGYAQTIERLAARFPKKQYWSDLIARVAQNKEFSARLELDLMRLMRTTGTLDGASAYEQMAQAALQSGYAAEAQQVIDEADARKLFGDAQRKLREQVAKSASADKVTAADENAARAAKDGNALVNTGFALVTSGQAERGIALMEQGIAKGGLKYPDEARLHLGAAQAMAGRKDDAARTLASVQGKDGSADLARVWITYAQGKGATASAN